MQVKKITYTASRQNLKTVPVDFLRECLDYYPETGHFVWKKRPPSHFPDERARKIFNTRFAGQLAGGRRKGEWVICVSMDEDLYKFSAHHLAMLLSGITLPDDKLVDHKDGDPFNNSLSNLRICTESENRFNAKTSRRNSSGYPGVYREGDTSWFARITVHGDIVPLGWYTTREEAIEARKAAEVKYFGNFRRDNPVTTPIERTPVLRPLDRRERKWLNSIGNL